MSSPDVPFTFVDSLNRINCCGDVYFLSTVAWLIMNRLPNIMNIVVELPNINNRPNTSSGLVRRLKLAASCVLMPNMCSPPLRILLRSSLIHAQYPCLRGVIKLDR